MNPTETSSKLPLSHTTDSSVPESTSARLPYRAPQVHSTEAFERMALLSCGDDASQPEECAEL